MMPIPTSPLDRLAVYANAHEPAVVVNARIDQALYQAYGVKRGLRDQNGKGVLAGLTNISEIQSYQQVEDQSVPCDGKLWYRGYNIVDLVNGVIRDQRYGFEEITYLLLFGMLPTPEQLSEFAQVLAGSRTLPTNFARDVIMKAPSADMMNS